MHAWWAYKTAIVKKKKIGNVLTVVSKLYLKQFNWNTIWAISFNIWIS